MEQEKVVLDSSAILAVLRSEPGREVVEKFGNNVMISSVNISEVISSILLKNPIADEESCRGWIDPFINSIVPFDTEQSFLAASLIKFTKHKGLSLGDRACVALGIITKAKIYTADKVWKDLKIEGADIQLIR